jgi:hypothetical protein
MIPLSGTTSSQHMKDDIDISPMTIPLENQEIESINDLLLKAIGEK